MTSVPIVIGSRRAALASSPTREGRCEPQGSPAAWDIGLTAFWLVGVSLWVSFLVWLCRDLGGWL